MKRSYGALTYYADQDYQTTTGARTQDFKRPRVAAIPVRTSALTMAQKREVDREILRITRNKADKNVANADSGTAGTAVPNDGIVTSVLQNIVQGDSSVNNFQGEGITPLGLTVRWEWENSGADSLNMVRIMVIQFFGTGPASPPGAVAYLSNVGGALAPLSNKDWEFRKQFKILADSNAIQLQNDATFVGGNGQAVTGKFYIPGRKIRKIFFGIDGVIQKNDLAILAITDSEVANHPILKWCSQLVFTDNS